MCYIHKSTERDNERRVETMKFHVWWILLRRWDTFLIQLLDVLPLLLITVWEKNEKKITICFIILLSEIGLLSCVTLLFCIQGYTGNAANIFFNLLKDEYHKKDIFTYEWLFNILNENPHVEVKRTNTEYFM